MPLIARDLQPAIERARMARDEAEIARDRTLSLAYRAAMAREEARALRAEARQAARRAALRRAG